VPCCHKLWNTASAKGVKGEWRHSQGVCTKRQERGGKKKRREKGKIDWQGAPGHQGEKRRDEKLVYTLEKRKIKTRHGGITGRSAGGIRSGVKDKKSEDRKLA